MFQCWVGVSRTLTDKHPNYEGQALPKHRKISSVFPMWTEALFQFKARKSDSKVTPRLSSSMKYAYTILYVPNVTQAIEFYENAFGFARGFIHECGDYGELRTGATTLSFASLSLAESNIEGGVTPSELQNRPPAFELTFSTDDVASAYDRALAAGALPAKPPTVKPWGQTVAYVRDLNGNLVEICTPIPTALV